MSRILRDHTRFHASIDPISVILRDERNGVIRFQRAFAVGRTEMCWTAQEQSLFIDSLLLGLPVGSIYLLATDECIFEVVDGLQRLLALRRFVSGRARLTLADSPYDGAAFRELSQLSQERILAARVNAIAIHAPPIYRNDVVTDLYARVNARQTYAEQPHPIADARDHLRMNGFVT